MSDEQISYIHTPKNQSAWDWWSEDPIELILMTFFLVFFFALPMDGCGVSKTQEVAPSAPAVTSPADLR